jgi:uncharacterized membrane protein
MRKIIKNNTYYEDENDINYANIAFKLGLIYFLSLTMSFAICMTVFYKKFGTSNTNEIYATIISGIIGFIAFYLLLGFYLRKNQIKWNIALINEYREIKPFKGLALVYICWGYFWRSIIIGIATGSFASLLKTINGEYLTAPKSILIDGVMCLLTAIFAFYWLLKYQYGNHKIIQLNVNNFNQFTSAQNNQPNNVEYAKKSEQTHDIIRETENMHDYIDYSDNDKDNNTSTMLIATFSTLISISGIIISFVQVYATYNFFKSYMHWNDFFSLFASGFGGIPILGTILSIIAATKIWGWQLWTSIILFSSPIISYILFAILVSFFGDRNKNY